ncbi:hypothetical protein ACFWOL_11225 [Streptomyces sp. NPDC058442]|uniref:hypothetical protein n=1 Tax=Streptomyces sp. NPDC058442 TaxID=3346503 RepID=UPI0036593C8B
MSGCTFPPCGEIYNKSNRSVQIRWDDNNSGWKYGTVAPGGHVGGWFNDGRDIDGWNAPTGCQSAYSDHPGAIYYVYGGWQKIASNQTVTIHWIKC